MGKPQLEVKGTQQVESALKEVAARSKDLSEAHSAEASMLLGDVQKFTRYDTGALQAGWEPEGTPGAAQFTNRVSYAGVQEFGWAQHNIEPSLAVEKAFNSNTSRTEQIYADAIADIARKANIEVR
jgi:hypothetical protein